MGIGKGILRQLIAKQEIQLEWLDTEKKMIEEKITNLSYYHKQLKKEEEKEDGKIDSENSQNR